MRKVRSKSHSDHTGPAAQPSLQLADANKLQNSLSSNVMTAQGKLIAAMRGSSRAAIQQAKLIQLQAAASASSGSAYNPETHEIEPPSGGKDTADSAADTAWTRQAGLALLGPMEEGEQGSAPGHEESPGEKEDAEFEKDPAKADQPVADFVDASKLLSFMKVPADYQKLKKAETSFEKFDDALKADKESEKEKREEKAGSENAEEDSEVEEYTGGIIDLVKSGFSNCMKLKTAYEEYQLIKEDSAEDASALEGAKIAFETALSGTSSVLSAINEFQKSSGAAASMAMQAAIPAIGIAMSTISLIGRIVTLVQQGNFDFGKTAKESQTESILSGVSGDEKKKEEVKQVLESDKFRSLIVAAAEYRQQERDNPKIFAEYRRAQNDEALLARLRKRYPDNYARIEEIHNNNALGIEQIGPEMQKLKQLGVTDEMIEAIIGDQTLINHLEEVKEKRTTNAKIGIFTDLVNIGADIATLTGTGAVAGAAMRAGTAAIGAARAGGNAIKFAARGKGAEDFAEGAEGGLFGASLYDSTDILKSDEAKQERYFHSSRRLLDNIADHDKQVADADKGTTKERAAAINKDYGWVETKILGTGASVTLIKAMANKKTGNELVQYFMDKLKTR
ncbi:MAG: hypothetical protein MI746_09795 [Pseudomonadales bacterium]|nr:hypothetical protein [Pseudomonadales bacterium]